MRRRLLLGLPGETASRVGCGPWLGQGSDGYLCGLHRDQPGTLDGDTWLLSSGLSFLLERAGGELTFTTHCFLQLWVSFGGVDLHGALVMVGQ